MNIGIIDADLIGRTRHRFPNLVCMKLSAYYKNKGNNVVLLLDYNKVEEYDKVYIAKVFTDTEAPKDILNLSNVECGGTGFYYDNAKPLPYEIEHTMPDYHLYDNYVKSKIESGENKTHFKYYLDYSIGFMTRGCFRKCSFCVNKNYNRVQLHSPLSEFLDSNRSGICLLDDNILGYTHWNSVFEELQASGKKFQFKQGLDERLLTDEKCEYLANSRYDGDYIFAFDNIIDKDIIINKARLLRNYIKKEQKIKFYVLCAYDRQGKYDEDFWLKDIKDTFERVFILAEFGFKPYIMRYEAYKNSNYYGTYVNLATWCNQPSIFWKLSYKEFVIKDNERKGGKSATLRYYEQVKNKFEYEFNVVPNTLKDLWKE